MQFAVHEPISDLCLHLDLVLATGEGGCDFILLKWILGIVDEGEKCEDRDGEGAGSEGGAAMVFKVSGVILGLELGKVGKKMMRVIMELQFYFEFGGVKERYCQLV